MGKPKHPWYKQRKYIHFDLPISLKQAELVVTNPSIVKKHSFYPFISYEITSKKISRESKNAPLVKKVKSRPVSYAAHIDSHIYSYYSCIIGSKYEEYLQSEGLGDCVIAFRKLDKKSNIHFANNAFNNISDIKECTAIALDITSFFDNLNHKILKEAWQTILGVKILPDDHYNVFKSITKYSKVDKFILYNRFCISKNNTKKYMRICEPKSFREIVRKEKLIIPRKFDYGIPQGSSISALLSNVYMINFDKTMYSNALSMNGIYYRYCDDILLIVPHKFRDQIIEIALSEIKKLKLEINNTKTMISKFILKSGQLTCDKPLQYLGFLFDGQRKLIRSSALARYSERMKSGVKLAKLTKIKANSIRIMKSLKPQKLYKKKLYESYSHLGRKNFIRYGFRSAEIMESNAIKRQLKPLWKRLKDEIEKN